MNKQKPKLNKDAAIPSSAKEPAAPAAPEKPATPVSSGFNK
jgi:hypothetical protein